MKPYLNHFFLLIKRLSLAFLIFTLCRILFYVFNTAHFSPISFSLFFYGLRFDAVAISYLFLPFIILSIIPFSFRNFDKYQKVLIVFFHIGNTLGIFLNLIDVVYFNFTLKRSTTDLFSMLSASGGSDFFKLFYVYLIDFWYVYLLLIGLIILSVLILKKYCKFKGHFQPYLKKDYLIHGIIFIFLVGFTVIGTRGGIQYKPIDMINAGQYASAQNIPIVLNTPFTIIKTLLIDNLSITKYYPKKELASIYTPVKKIKPYPVFKGKNVVIIILESFAKEYVGGFNKGKGYTPFLDSLIKQSYVFNNAYANGQRSIEALPSILSSIPAFMNTPFIVSNYAGNTINGLPKVLKKYGYNTSFYHGGENGTMGFNGFVGTIGVDKYYGLNEYPEKEKDFDGHWGIFDEPYLQYFAKELNKKPQPFFSAIFTLSSHHPYKIPKKYINKFPKGNLPLHETVGYTDFSLKEFFKTAKKMPWFNNTIFVFTADHSAQSNSPKYNTTLGRFAIPIFIYDPLGELKGTDTNYFQQIDIYPTILSLLGINENIVSFGNNAFDNATKYVIHNMNKTYQIASNNYLLIFNGEKATALYNIKKDSLLSNNLIYYKPTVAIKNKLERKLKAIIQQYNNRMINNKLTVKK